MSPGTVDLVAVERRIQEATHAVGRELMAEALKRADATAPEVTINGASWGNRRTQKATYVTVFGEVEVERGIYQETGRGPVAVPLELRLGIVEGRYTPVVARVLSRAIGLMTASEAEGFLQETGVARVSVSTLHRVPRAMAARYEQRREVIEASVRAAHGVPAEATVVQVGLDGVMVPQDGEHAGRRGRKSADPEPPRHEIRYGPPTRQSPASIDDKSGRAWHEASVGTIAFWDRGGRHLGTTYLARMPESRKEALFEQLEEELHHVLALRPELDVAFASDGAPCHWTGLEAMAERLPSSASGQRFFLVDLFHLLERLGKAAALIDGEGTPEAKVRLATWRETLKSFDDGAHRLLKMLRYHRDKETTSDLRAKLQQVIDYLADQTSFGRTRYAEAIAADCPVGTGVVEAAAKTIVSVRMKRAGARFSQHGGQSVLLFRAAVLSDRFVTLSRELETTYTAVVREAA